MKKILLDIGGTFIKCSDGRTVPVDSNGTRDSIVAAFREAVRGAGDSSACSDPVEVRAAVPGPFDYATGQFLMKHKFAALYGEYFADLVGLPRECCRFSHDVNCMLLGEVRRSSDAGKAQNTAMIALGTGLGFAMFIDGALLKNELGSPKVSIYNRPFRDGVLEDFASKRGVQRLFGRSDLTVKEIADLARGGDAPAVEAFSRMGTVIGQAIAPILSEYRVARLLLGGQISRSWDLFAPALKAELPSSVSVVEPISDFDNTTFNGLEAL